MLEFRINICQIFLPINNLLHKWLRFNVTEVHLDVITLKLYVQFIHLIRYNTECTRKTTSAPASTIK